MDRAFHLPEHLAGERWDRALASLCPDLSKARLQKLARAGDVTVDGKRLTRTNGVARGGEAVRVCGVEAPPLEVLHEDEHVAFVVKPSGLLTHPTGKGEDDSLAARAVQRFGDLPKGKGQHRPGIVHRLDRETSGVLVIARTQKAMNSLENQFRERTVQKRYDAWVIGNLEDDEFEVDDPLEPEGARGDRQQVAAPGRGQSAHTRFRRIASAGTLHWIECSPITGRRHQLRVHLASRGLPILGDPLYRPPASVKALAQSPRLALHARELTIRHPATGDGLRVRSELPDDLAPLAARFESAESDLR